MFECRGMARRGLGSVLAGLLMMASAALAQTVENHPVLTATGQSRVVKDFEQLGHKHAIPLRGVEDRRGIAFGVRADQRVRRLVLDLAYMRSAALLEDYSHLNVLLNGEVVSTILLTKDDRNSATLSRAEVNVPTRFLQRHNVLEMQLIGHYTLGCENPVHPDLWADIATQSRLLLEVEPVVLPNDLSQLPVPFFDAHDMSSLRLPFVVFNPSPTRLEAAGVLASWFGALADYRGAHFPVSTSAIPAKGHAVVIANTPAQLAALDLPAPQGPTIAMRANPNDPAGKLLVITGRNEQDIRQAAVAVATGGESMTGDVLKVDALEVDTRKPYDAPRWLPSDRPVAFGELVPTQDLTRHGYAPAPIVIGIRLPPDLSDWRTKLVPVDLRYHHSAATSADGGVLDVAVNLDIAVDYFPVKRIVLADTGEAGRQWLSGDGSILRRKVDVPLSTLGSLASMQFQFNYTAPPQKECRGGLVDNRRSSIDPGSTIDISRFPHYKAMPDLAAFLTAGFPFTKMADLSETVVFLPKHAADAEYTAMLDLLGVAGRSTGLAGYGVEVRSGADSNEGLADKDVLLIETRSESVLLEEWRPYVPRLDPDVRKVLPRAGAEPPSPFEWKVGHLIDRASRFLGGHAIAARQDVNLINPARAYLAGFESPLTSGRSVVVLAASSGEQLVNAVGTLIDDDAQMALVQGSLVAIDERGVETLSLDKTYWSGRLSLHETVLFFFSHSPVALLGGYLLCAFLISAVMYLTLRARARARLKVRHDDGQ